MIIYVILTALSFLEFVPYQLLLKSYISFLLVRCKSVYFAKLVKIFCNFQKLKTFAQKANSFINLILPPSLYELINYISYKNSK